MLRHQHTIKYLFNRELSEMYISIALRNLALSMAGIFVPIYLFIDLKYPLTKVILFFIIYTITLILSNLLAAKFTSKYGIKHGILASMFGFILYTILLATLPYHHLFFLPPILWGMSNAFYWVNFHTDFTRFSDKKNRGQEVSIWFITAFLGILIGPILGSIIITYLGFTTLFVVVSLIFLLSAVPLFLTSEVYEPVNFSIKELFDRSHLKETYFYLVYGFKTMVAQFALPIFIFLLLGQYISLGIIASFSAMGSITIGYMVGKLSKNEIRENKMIKYGSLFHSLGWFLLLFVKTFIQITVVNIYLAMSFILIEIPHHTLMYTKAKKRKRPMEYIVYREMAMGFGRLLSLVVILLTGKLIIGFILSGLGIFSWFFL